MKIKKTLLAGLLGLAGIAGAAQAAPITYTLNVQGAAGTLNGASFGPGASAVLTIQADTLNIVTASFVGFAGSHCVPADFASVSVNGGAAVQILDANFCATPDGYITGVTSTSVNPASGVIYMDFSSTVAGFPGGAWDLATPDTFGPVTHVGTNISTGGNSLSLSGGGTLYFTAPTAVLSGTTLQVSPSAPVPTLSEWATGLLVLMLGGLAVFGVRRQREGTVAA
ncbi:MAG: IPTL-CTERM sorting domain-containing protein [Halothiobacillaceae bacterium]|nr:IPTL-CTERM sorting domain-containing protein [Halothiobacillaceae bacterium]